MCSGTHDLGVGGGGGKAGGAGGGRWALQMVFHMEVGWGMWGLDIGREALQFSPHKCWVSIDCERLVSVNDQWALSWFVCSRHVIKVMGNILRGGP